MEKQFQIPLLTQNEYAKARENQRRILGCPQDNWKNDPTIQGQKRVHEGKKTRVSWLLVLYHTNINPKVAYVKAAKEHHVYIQFNFKYEIIHRKGMGMGDFISIMTEAVSDMPEKLKVATDGFRGLGAGFHDLVRRT